MKSAFRFILFLTCSNCLSAVFYLDLHSNGTTFREKFIIPVILSEPFASLMKPNMLIHILRTRPHSYLYNRWLGPSHLIGHWLRSSHAGNPTMHWWDVMKNGNGFSAG